MPDDTHVHADAHAGPHQQPDVEPFIARVRAGEVDACRAIIRRYQRKVWGIAAFALRDAAATEDLGQQVFVNADLALDRFEAGRDFGASSGSGSRSRCATTGPERRAW